MSDTIVIELDDNALMARINRAIKQLEHPQDLMEAIGAKLEANVQDRFDAKVDPNGQPWAPLSPTTIEIYESEWFKKQNPVFASGIPGSLLQRTRQMRDHLTHNAGPDYAEVGFTPYRTKGGKWSIPLLHEFGTSRMPDRGLLTANPFTGELGAQDREDVLAAVEGFLADLL